MREEIDHEGRFHARIFVDATLGTDSLYLDETADGLEILTDAANDEPVTLSESKVRELRLTLARYEAHVKRGRQ